MTKHHSDFEPLAIVGIGCKFPGDVSSPTEFWSLLRDGRCAIKEWPSDRWSMDAFFDRNKNALGKSSAKWGGFVEGIRDFDAEFFGISPREAEAMDPQQRMILTAVWEAFEDAGVSAERLRGSNTAVFVGASTFDYANVQHYRRTSDNLHTGTGNALCIIANRVSHKFDFHGPSITIDTACSSSIVATDMACRAIWSGQSDIAVAGGVNALLEPGIFISFSKANMISRTGRIRTFDAEADGFVRSEGAGALIIKRLSQAIEDGDRVYSVIRGTKVNQDGHTSTISVPSSDAQIAMLGDACKNAGVGVSDIDYVEAHGTGTPIGDPIEARAIGTVFGRERNRRQKVLVGACKTNVGHLEAGAGMAGIIKASLSLHNREIPRNINFKRPNPNIPFDDLGIGLPLEHTSWEADNGRPRRAAVNAFGIGGTNACAILEEAPRHLNGNGNGHGHANGKYLNGGRQYWFVPLGAQTEKALGKVASSIATTMEAQSDENGTHAVAANLALRRAHLTFRAAALADAPTDVVKILKHTPKAIESGKKNEGGLITGKRIEEPRIVFAFAGQGGTWWGMAHGLLKHDDVFRQTVEEIDRLYKEIAGWSIKEELLKSEADANPSTTHALPCLFALQSGLVARWKAWGIKPSMVIGHSSGELATAYAAGILTLPDALQVVYHRSRLQATQEGRGGIAAVALSRAEVERDLEEFGLSRLDIAAVNGPGMVNIAGDNESLRLAVEKLKAKHGEDMFATVLKVDFAPHCHHMEPLRDELLDSLKDVRPNASTVPMVSTVTGHLLIGQMGDATYWWRNIRDAVLFDQGLKEALRLGGNVFIEIGPHINLSPMISAALSERGQAAVVVPSLNRKEEYDKVLRNSLATLYVNGVEPKWETFYGNTVPRLDLPSYPWEKKPFWMDSEESRAVMHGPRFHSLLGPRHFAPQPIWQGEISLEEHDWLVGHTVDGSVIFPGTGYLEMMFAAGREVFGEGAIELENVEILEAMVLSNERNEMVQTTYEPGRNRISIYSKPRGSNLDWILRAKATMRRIPEHVRNGDRIRAPKKGAIAASELYKRMHARGYMHADAFNALRKLWPGDTTSVGQLRARAPIAGYEFHPALSDSCLHVGFGLGAGLGAQSDKLYLPVRLDRVTLYHTLNTPNLWARAEAVSFDPYVAINNVFVEDERGNPVLDIVGFTARSIPGRAPAAETKALKPVYIVEDWIETEAKLATKASAGRGQAWIVLREKPMSGLAARAEASLAERGADVITVTPNGSFKKLAAGMWQVDPTNPADFERLIAEVLASRPKHKQRIDGIVFGWGTAAAERVEDINVDTLRSTEQRATIAAMHLLQGLVKNPDQRPRVWFLTRGVLPAGETPSDARLETMLAGAPLAGFARTALAEQPDLRSTVLDFDFDSKAAKAQASDVAGLLLGETDETEIALRGDKWFVPRLRQASDKGLPPKVAPYKTKELTRHYRAWMDEPGDLDDIRLVEMDELHPGKNQVKVAVKGAALNFHDVMAATGMMPLGADLGIPHEELGYEYGGVITEVGAGVKGWKVGDRVMGMAAASFASEMVAEILGVYKMPKGVKFTDAATIPIAFSTAYYGLVHWARLRKGETALLHLGTGGVGLAAIQIARHIGAKIITTAGSPEKRAYLKKMGIEHVFDSRSTSFAEDVRRATNGKGVNVVLNALGGDAIPLGVNVMAPGGRFCEIGKRDVFDDSALGLRALRQNGQFFVLDMARMHLDDPQGMKDVMDAVQDLFGKGVYKALPVVCFKAGEIRDAFKTMAQAKHIGKVVIDFGLDDIGIDLSTKHQMQVSPNGAYLISGGLGGFGAQTARWLAERGAKHLWLIGRSGASRPEAKELLAGLKKMGVKAHVITADISKRSDVDAVIKQIAKSKMPLRGVVHSAMVLDDAFITQLDKSRIMPVLEPKILGAWNLHQATEGKPLDFFVMYSSLASVFGSTGQANYVSANRFLDLLAGHRQRMGLPGTAVNWGTLGGTGAVQRSKKLLKYFKSMGMPPMDPTETLDCLGVVMRKDVAQVGACKVDWKLVTQTNTALRRLPRFSEVAATGQGGQGGGRIRSELLATKGADRERILADFLAQQVAKVLKVEAKTIDLKRPLNEIGLDSLSSFQLKNRIESEVGVSLPVGKFLQKPTIISLSTTISEVLDTTRAEKRDGASSAKDNSTALLPSPRQEWLWQQIRDNGPMPMHGMRETIAAIKIKPAIDVERLNQAFRALVDHHEMLRSAFPASADGKPTLATLPLEKFNVRGIDATQLSEDEFMVDLRKLANTPHDIENGPLIDVRVFHRPDQNSVVVLRAHGILLDGWAFGAILREMFQGYFGLSAAKEGEKSKGFFDYSRWHRRWLEGDEAKKARSYWGEKLANLPAPLALGGRDTSLFDPHARGFWTKRYVKASEGWEAREAARSLGVSLHALFVAAYHAHIYGVTGAKDIVIQSNAANRTKAEQEQMVGWFANEIFARTAIDPSLTLREHVQRVTQALQESMEHTGYPTHLILEAARETNRGAPKPHFVGFNMMWPDNMDRSGFEQIMFQAEGTVHRFGTLELTMLPAGVEGAGSYLNDTQIAYQEVDGDILVSLHAREGVFENPAAAAAYLDRFLRVLPQALKNPDLTIAELAEIT